MKWLRLALRNVLRHQRRSIMAALIVATGTTTVLISTGYMLATFWGLREATIREGVGHIQIGAHGQFDAFGETSLQYGLDRDTTAFITSQAEAMPQTKTVLRRILFEGLVSTGNITMTFIGQGVEPEKEALLAGTALPLLAGEPLPSASGADQMQVVLAVDLARALGARPGDSVTLLSTTADGALNGIDVTVSGLYQTGVPEYDQRALMVPVPAAQALLKSDAVSRLIVSLTDTETTDMVASTLAAANPDSDIRRWIDLAPFYQKVVTLYRGIFTVMGGIILLIVFLSVTNTMLMSVMERTREAGTMMALGIPRGRLRANFLLEGAIIGAAGGLIGLIVAALMVQAVNGLELMMPAPPGRSNPVPLLLFTDGPLYGGLFLVMIFLGALSAWLPTRSITRLKIVKALGHV